jgi:hypothetical protein
VSEAELRQLRESVRGIERAEGLKLGSDEHDPRPKFRKLVKIVHRLSPESADVIKSLMRQWGVTSPPALEVATALSSLLQDWAALIVEKVGLVSAALPDEEES